MGDNSADWRNSPVLKRISQKSIERVDTFFTVETRAVSKGHIFHTLKSVDDYTLKRIVEVMVEHGILEQIETNASTYYRKVR